MSISPFELRLGNLVDVLNESGYLTPDGYNWKIVELRKETAIVEKMVLGHTTEWEVKYNLLSPITLTEDWLKRCGIEKDVFGDITFRVGDMDIFWNSESFYIQVLDSVVGSWNLDLSHIKYLHQFQNIYNSLTNKELTIKEVI